MQSGGVSQKPNAAIAVLVTIIAVLSAVALPVSLTESTSRGHRRRNSPDGAEVATNIKHPVDSSTKTRGDGSPSPTPANPSPVRPPTPDIPVVEIVEQTVGQSVKGRPIVCRTLGSGNYVVLMMASIHGNEAAGTPLLNDLTDHVKAHPAILDGVTLVLMPEVNPDGVASNKRYNTRGVDLNRNFPARNRQNSSRYGMNALSEPEALAIYQVLNNTIPNHIVTLHQPLQCVDYDGPAKQLAQTMSEFCPLPVKKLGSRPGSLGSYAGVTLGIPTVTFELPRNAATQSPELLWRFYGEALVQAVRHRHQPDKQANQQSDSPR